VVLNVPFPSFPYEVAVMVYHRIPAILVVSLVVISGVLPLDAAPGLMPTADEMATASRFAAARFEALQSAAPEGGLFAPEPPFSFLYGGRPSAEFLGTWKTDRQARKLDAERTAHTVTYADPAGGLTVRCEAIVYHDFPTVEWTLYFKNAGSADTPIIENLQALDVQWERGQSGEYLLHHNVGSPHDGTDYAPRETVLAPGESKRITAAGGRSTWTDLSYFNLQRSNDEGLIVVVGWPGQWAADFIRDAGQGIHLRAGQELTHFKLHPDEEVRTPLIVLQFWQGGDWIRSQNIWRR
jgi:alpha-galactosidase